MVFGAQRGKVSTVMTLTAREASPGAFDAQEGAETGRQRADG
jgi:hypothetical protein